MSNPTENDCDSEITAVLGTDERLVWTGGPRSGIRWQLPELGALLWCGFAIF